MTLQASLADAEQHLAQQQQQSVVQQIMIDAQAADLSKLVIQAALSPAFVLNLH